MQPDQGGEDAPLTLTASLLHIAGRTWDEDTGKTQVTAGRHCQFGLPIFA